MRKLILLTLSLCTSYAMATSQMQVPQAQVMMIMNPGASVGPDTGTVGTNPDLSYEMMSNQSGVGKELYLLQAKEAGEINNPITTGGLLQTNITTNANNTTSP